MITKYFTFRRMIIGLFCGGVCLVNFAAYALDEDEDSGNDTDEDIKNQIATVKGLSIPKTEFEIQTEMTETKQSKAKTEAMAKVYRRRAKNIKDFLAKPENQPAKRKSQFASIRSAFDERIRSAAAMEQKEFVSLITVITNGIGEFDDSAVSDEEREALKAVEALRAEASRLVRASERLKPEEVRRFREQLLDDNKLRLYETALEVPARLRAERAQKSDGLAAEEDSLAKAYADHLNKLSEALAGQTKNQAKVVNNLVEKLPLILGILCALFAVIILLVRFFPVSIQIEWVNSGQVIQLLTVVTLLLIILCLAVTDILKENIIGTLLGGIGGYVLSQGIGRAAARAATRMQQAQPDNIPVT